MKNKNKKIVKEEKPAKKSDKELWSLVEEKIQKKEYLISHHARKRQRDRNITDIDILDILENRLKRNRKRNKKKDEYIKYRTDWNYCVEGLDLDNKNKIRIIISFTEESNLLVITAIKLDNLEKFS